MPERLRCDLKDLGGAKSFECNCESQKALKIKDDIIRLKGDVRLLVRS